MSRKIIKKISLRAYMTYSVHLFKSVFKNDHQELKPVFRQYIPEDANIIDIGAHAGQFSKLFAKMAPKGHVYSFEPASYTRSILIMVKALNCLNNVTIIPLGLGDNNSEVTLNMPIKASGSVGYGLSHIGEIKQDDKRVAYQETISIIKLDDYIDDNKITRVDFIKADVEGWELRMLYGAKKTIEKYKPTLFLEINDSFLGRAGDNAEDMLTFIEEHSYDVFIMDNKDGIPALREISSDDNNKNLSYDILCIQRLNE